MNDIELDMMLDRWSDAIALRVPQEDARRTDECLRYDEIALLTQNKGKEALVSRQSHIPRCAWCLKAVAMIASHLESGGAYPVEDDVEDGYNSQRGLVYRANVAASFQEEESPFVAGLGTYVGDWLRSQAVPMEEETPAFFDTQGTLHIALEGLPSGDSMRVNLLINGAPMSVGSGVVVGGRLQIARPMPEFGLKSVRLSAELVAAEPLAHT